MGELITHDKESHRRLIELLESDFGLPKNATSVVVRLSLEDAAAIEVTYKPEVRERRGLDLAYGDSPSRRSRIPFKPRPIEAEETPAEIARHIRVPKTSTSATIAAGRMVLPAVIPLTELETPPWDV